MSAILDMRYADRRERLMDTVVAAAERTWDTHYHDRAEAIGQLGLLVKAGQKQVVAMSDGYITQKLRAAGEDAESQVDPDTFVLTRGLAPYDAVFGALGGQLGEGADFRTAMQAARARLSREVRTDLQIAFSKASHERMQSEPAIGGWARVVAGTCAYCAAAAADRYSDADPMPFHENCKCTATPVIGETVTKRTNATQEDEFDRLETQGDPVQQLPRNDGAIDDIMQNRPDLEDVGMRSEIEGVMKEQLDASQVRIHITDDALEEVIKSGEFLNQHMSGRSMGFGRTMEQEGEWLGIVSDDPRDFPIYGSFGGDFESLSGYGDIRVFLNDSVKIRSTVTYDDSIMMSNGAVTPSPAANPQAYSLSDALTGEAMDAFNDLDNIPGTYVEAQIYGPVRVSDIDYVELPRHPEENIFTGEIPDVQRIAALLQAAGIKVVWV